MSDWEWVPLRQWYSCCAPWGTQSNLRKIKIKPWSLYFLQIWPILVAILLLLCFVARCSWKCFVYSSTTQLFQKINLILLKEKYSGSSMSVPRTLEFLLQSLWFCFWCRTPIPFHQCLCILLGFHSFLKGSSPHVLVAAVAVHTNISWLIISPLPSSVYPLL